MDYHKNARTTVWSREEMARRVTERGSTLAAAAAAASVSAKTAAKWVSRYRQHVSAPPGCASIAEGFGFGSVPARRAAEDLSDEVSRMLVAIMSKLRGKG